MVHCRSFCVELLPSAHLFLASGDHLPIWQAGL